MSVVNDTNKDHVLSYEGLEDVVAKIKNTFVRNTKQASDAELGLIKALDNTDVQLNELQGHDPDGNNYPVQIISDGTAFVNMPKPETISVVDEKVKNEVITDTTKPYFLLGQPSQNITGKAGTDENCFIKDGAIYSSSTKVLTEANLEDSERTQRDDNTWSYVHFDSDGFMGVDVPTISNPDWNTNDAEDKSFIKNRTHYDTELIITSAGTYNVPIDSIYNHTLSAINGNMNGLTTPITLEVGVRTQIHSGPPVWVTLSENGTLLVEEGSTGYVAAYNIKYSYVVQLNEKYIPDVYVHKGEPVDFANDLTGHLEVTEEIFTYRPTAGETSVRDESAVIKRIKGNTVVFAQLSNHRSDLRREGDWSVAPEVTANTWGGISTPVQVIAGHKYLFYINTKDGRSITDTYTLLKDTHRVEFNTPLFITAEETASWRWTALYKTSTNGLRFQTQAFDLTRLFDAGNEPTTIEEFKSKFPDSYYPYSNPEIRNVITNQITTTGFNQWDEQWELGALATDTGGPVGNNKRGRSVNFFDVIPNASYYCATIAPTTTDIGGTVGSIGVWWYDSNQTFIKYEDITNRTRIAPFNARYAKICSYGGDVNTIFNGGININLSHSGVRNGEYKPYKKHVCQLPEILKYFPDGMNGNANVWDEINTEKAIKRWGVIDLGTLTWSVQSESTNIFWSNSVSSLKKTSYNSYPNAISTFDIGRFYDLQIAKSGGVTTEIIGVHDAQARIMIYNPNYEATTEGASQLKASLEGVLLYYELVEPIETPITEAIQLVYNVEDFGTEMAIGSENSAPFRADIVYKFNAVDRIRQNDINIKKLENKINTITDIKIPESVSISGLRDTSNKRQFNISVSIM